MQGQGVGCVWAMVAYSEQSPIVKLKLLLAQPHVPFVGHHVPKPILCWECQRRVHLRHDTRREELCMRRQAFGVSGQEGAHVCVAQVCVRKLAG